MNYILILIGLAVIALTAFTVSFVAKKLDAKRSGIGWVLLSMIVGSLIGGVAFVALPLFAAPFFESLPSYALPITTFIIAILTSTIAFKFINGLNWVGALSTNFASMGLSTIFSIVGVFVATLTVGGFTVGDVIKQTTSQAKNNSQIATSIAEQVKNGDSLEASIRNQDFSSNENIIFEEPVNAGENLISTESVESNENGIVTKTTTGKKRTIKAAKYHVISIGRANSVIGKKVRVRKNSGNIITGALENTSNNELIIKQRIGKGFATTPIALSHIQKLEVFR